MSGLAAVLAGHHEPGVFLWHAAFAPDEVRHAVEHAGRRFGYVDGWHDQTKQELLTSLGQALELPSYYGANLDALDECLGALPGPAVLLWDGWGTLARADQAAFDAVLAVLRDHTDTLTTLLRGEGPEVGLASLD